MELMLLGTGCPRVDYKRFGPANLISSKKTKILVDCGSGVTQRLDQAKISSAKIFCLEHASLNCLFLSISNSFPLPFNKSEFA